MILVTGATGTNGVELISQLAAMGEPCRALVRDPQESAKLLPPDTELFRGDLGDRAALDEAMRGIEKVFLLCPVHPKQVEWEGNVVDAAKAAGVRHLVKFSVIHASPESRSALLRWHAATEDRIRSSGVPFTFLRPNMFMQELLRQADAIRSQGQFYLPLAGAKVSLVDVRDNAAVAAAVLTGRGHEGKTYEITGPAALSFDEVALALAEATGRPIRYVPITMEQFKQAFAAAGAPQWMADVVAELYATFHPANSVVREGVKRATGKEPRTFDSFARENAAAIRPPA